jgi:hypothetical protein
MRPAGANRTADRRPAIRVVTVAARLGDAARTQAMPGEESRIELDGLRSGFDDQCDGAVRQALSGEPIAFADPHE